MATVDGGYTRSAVASSFSQVTATASGVQPSPSYSTKHMRCRHRAIYEYLQLHLSPILQKKLEHVAVVTIRSQVQGSALGLILKRAAINKRVATHKHGWHPTILSTLFPAPSILWTCIRMRIRMALVQADT